MKSSYMPHMNSQYRLKVTISYQKYDDACMFQNYKFLDQHGIKMTDVDPSIVEKHVGQLHNN